MLFDPNQSDGNVFGADTDDLADFIVAEIFQPQQDNSPVERLQTRDPFMQEVDLPVFGIAFVEKVQVQRKRQGTYFLLACRRNACVEAHPVNPGSDVAPAFKPFTVPADDTLATLLLEELQVTPFVAVTGVMEAVNLEE